MLSNSTAAILNQAWLRCKVKKVSPKYYSANRNAPMDCLVREVGIVLWTSLVGF